MALLWLSLLSAVSALEYPKDNYLFSYAVEDNYSGNEFGHTENRHGGDTAGAYHVRLPDGRLQTVQYTVDHYGGYRATVVYEGGQQKAPTAPAKFVHEPSVYSGGGVQPYFQPHFSPAYNFINHQPPPPAPPAPPAGPSPVLLPSYTTHQPHYHTQPAQPAYFILPQEHHVFPPSPAPPPPPPPPPPPSTPPPPPPPPPRPSPSPSPAVQPAANKHHLAFSVPLVKPSEHHPEDDVKTPDPYLASPEELKGRSFDSPFWYPQHRHIVKGYRNKDRGDKEDHRDYSVI